MEYIAKIGASSLNRMKTLVVSVTSGKGGVGKTVSAVNMAIAARYMGLRVLIFDGDFGLANVDIVLGIQGRYNIKDVLDGCVEMSDIIIPGPMGIDLIPSGSGLREIANLGEIQRIELFDYLSGLNKTYDMMIIDTGSGIAENVLHLNGFADEVVVVTNNEPHAMTDAYAMIKVLSKSYHGKSIRLVPNKVKSSEEGKLVWRKLSEIASRFLQIEIAYLGSIPDDPQLRLGVKMKKAASEESTHTISGQAWQQIVSQIIRRGNPENTLQDVFKSMMGARPSSQVLT